MDFFESQLKEYARPCETAGSRGDMVSSAVPSVGLYSSLEDAFGSFSVISALFISSVDRYYYIIVMQTWHIMCIYILNDDIFSRVRHCEVYILSVIRKSPSSR